MESKDSGVWAKGEPVTLQKPCLFLRKGISLELDKGSVLIPLEETSKRSIKITDVGKVYVWPFLLPDGSVTDFYLHTASYIHSKNVERDMKDHMKTYFAKPKKSRKKT